MKLRSAMRRPAVIAAVTVGAVALGLGGTAVGAALITGDDVKDNSLTGKDIKTNSITYSDIANGTVRSTEVTNGSLLLRDLSPEAIAALGAGVRQLATRIDAALAAVAGDVNALKVKDTAIRPPGCPEGPRRGR